MRRRPLVASVLFVLWATAQGASLALDRINTPEFPISDYPVVLSAFVAFASLGALLIARTRNSIGPLFMGVALGTAVANLTGQIAEYGYRTNPGSIPAAPYFYLGDGAWFPSFTFLILAILVFPDGHLASRHWTPAAWSAALGGFSILVSTLIRPGPLGDLRDGPPNPIGIAELEGMANVLEFGFLLLLTAFVAGIVSLLLRFRRTKGVERQQFKWVAYAACFMSLLLGLGISLDSFLPDWVDNLTFGLVLLLMPAAIGLAVLRYRLFDIDLIINKTLVYGALTTLLGAGYFGAVVLLQTAFRPFISGGDLAIAGSTLAVAGVFRPLRRRVQAFVDRRFYRQKYDAARALESFTSRLTREIDLDSLNSELRTLLGDTMQPAGVTVWVRREAARPIP